MPALERAIAIWEAEPTDPAYEAETRFALARALAGTGRASEGQQQAQRARTLYDEHEGDHAEALAEIDAWLGAEASPEPG